MSSRGRRRWSAPTESCFSSMATSRSTAGFLSACTVEWTHRQRRSRLSSGPYAPHLKCASILVPSLLTFGFPIAAPRTSPPLSAGCATSLRNTVGRAIAWSSPRTTPATVCLWHSRLGVVSKQEGASDYLADSGFRIRDKTGEEPTKGGGAEVKKRWIVL